MEHDRWQGPTAGPTGSPNVYFNVPTNDLNYLKQIYRRGVA